MKSSTLRISLPCNDLLLDPLGAALYSAPRFLMLVQGRRAQNTSALPLAILCRTVGALVHPPIHWFRLTVLRTRADFARMSEGTSAGCIGFKPPEWGDPSKATGDR